MLEVGLRHQHLTDIMLEVGLRHQHLTDIMLEVELTQTHDRHDAWVRVKTPTPHGHDA